MRALRAHCGSSVRSLQGAPEHALSKITEEIRSLETTRENFESVGHWHGLESAQLFWMLWPQLFLLSTLINCLFVWVSPMLWQEMMQRIQEAAKTAVLEADVAIANALAKITCVLVQNRSG